MSNEEAKQEAICGIYKITSPTGKIYVGQSKDVIYRFKCYKRLSCKKQPRLYASLIKHGVQKHLFEVIIQCGCKELNRLERHYQNIHNSCGRNGLNCVLTESDIERREFSTSTKLLMSKSKIGTKHAKSTLIKMGLSQKGRIHTVESKTKMSNSKRGYVYSEKSKSSIKLSRMENYMLPIINTYSGIFSASIQEASEMYGIKYTSLYKMLNGIYLNKTLLKIA